MNSTLTAWHRKEHVLSEYIKWTFWWNLFKKLEFFWLISSSCCKHSQLLMNRSWILDYIWDYILMHMESSLHQSNTYHISSTITTTTPTVISILFDDMLCTICVTDSTILILTDLNGGRTTGSWRIVRAGAPQISPADGFSSDQYIHSYQVYIYWSILTNLVYFHQIYIPSYQMKT